MLSKENVQEIEAEMAIYPDHQAACVEALKIVQRSHGWVSDQDLIDVASILGMSPDELESVATFYPLIFRQPVGEHVLLVCNSVSCWMMGEPQLQKALSEELGIEYGETTQDGKFTLLPIPCLGDCDHAPAMIIDETLVHDIHPAEVGKLLAGYRD
jgi:NADH-quinone oxidoreductase subunit E